MKVLITGAAGFTARHLCQRLKREDGFSIFGSDTLPNPPRDVALDSYHPADLTDRAQVTELLRRTRPDWIFHLAGLFRGSAVDLYRVNLMGTLHLLEAVKTEIPAAAMLLVGSAAEYGIWPSADMPLREDHECRPVGAYGASKHAMTMAAQYYVRDAGLKAVVARPFNLIGAGMPTTLVAGAIALRTKTALAKGETVITIGNTDSQRDFVAIEDAVDAYVKLLQAGAWGEVFNISSGEPHSIDSVLQTLLSFAPKSIRVVVEESLKRPNDPPLVTGDSTKARRVCGFAPRVELRDSLRAAWNAMEIVK